MSGVKFFVATKNLHKLEELKRILIPMGFDVICEKNLESPLPETEETGITFEENALLKASAACKQTGLPSVADDSGLCVDALNGAPGVFSARFAGESCDNKANNKLLLLKLVDIPLEKRTAKFVSAVACGFPDGRQFTVRGECSGYIGFTENGQNGFGYDSLFWTDSGCFGLMDADKKDSISHRAMALTELKKELKKTVY